MRGVRCPLPGNALPALSPEQQQQVRHEIACRSIHELCTYCIHIDAMILQRRVDVNRRNISYLCYQFTLLGDHKWRPAPRHIGPNLMTITGWRYAKHVLFSAEGSRGLKNYRHKWRESRAYVAAKKPENIERANKGSTKIHRRGEGGGGCARRRNRNRRFLFF